MMLVGLGMRYGIRGEDCTSNRSGAYTLGTKQRHRERYSSACNTTFVWCGIDDELLLFHCLCYNEPVNSIWWNACNTLPCANYWIFSMNSFLCVSVCVSCAILRRLRGGRARREAVQHATNVQSLAVRSINCWLVLLVFPVGCGHWPDPGCQWGGVGDWRWAPTNSHDEKYKNRKERRKAEQNKKKQEQLFTFHGVPCSHIQTLTRFLACRIIIIRWYVDVCALWWRAHASTIDTTLTSTAEHEYCCNYEVCVLPVPPCIARTSESEKHHMRQQRQKKTTMASTDGLVGK